MWSQIKQKFNLRLISTLPYIVGSLLFIVTPLILMLIKSTKTIDNYNSLDVLQDVSMWKTLFRSVYLGIIAALVSLIIISPFTWIIARSDNKILRTLAMMMMISPLFIFSVVKVFSLRVLLLNIFDQPSLVPKDQWLIVLGMVYIYAPYMIIPLYSVIRNLPSNLIDASNDLGFSLIKTIFKVVLPYCMKAVFAGIAMVFMLSATTLLMQQTLLADPTGANESTRMIGNLIDRSAKDINLSDFSAVKTSTIAWITIVIMMSVYAMIYFAPHIYRKFKGEIHV